MFTLIPFGFGNRCPDIFGNLHVRRDDQGRVVLRDPGGYRGRHQEVLGPSRLQAILAWVVGERV